VIDGNSITGGGIHEHADGVDVVVAGIINLGIRLEAIPLRSWEMVLGIDWLNRNNPLVDWQAGTVRQQRELPPIHAATTARELDDVSKN
jgi:hypothetical protein